ncbi:GSCOCG00010396001-RA-CDS [Cotesia congregata]|uniref:Uncharacterized protein n=1 Tax=Cotesia congregata TaxID=51543 RepID=A0A8J2H6I5_COTCN|nr:GSCOCG00010396001-RA-CDS [Cotesia congregata]CAG5078479.1 Protein of unknown function [Cotesia congregata]
MLNLSEATATGDDVEDDLCQELPVGVLRHSPNRCHVQIITVIVLLIYLEKYLCIRTQNLLLNTYIYTLQIYILVNLIKNNISSYYLNKHMHCYALRSIL